MEPLLPDGSPDLEDRAREVVSRSATLGGQLHPVTRNSVVELLRIIKRVRILLPGFTAFSMSDCLRV
jgi:hypothetical protein